MRKFLPKISFITIFIVAIGVFILPALVHAEAVDTAAKVAEGVVGAAYGGVVGRIFWWVLIPLGSIVWNLLGLIIDAAAQFSLNSAFYSDPAIGLAWGVIRDIANMFFIFILIYEGIRTILNLGNLVSVRKTITGVIIAALFLNFSLFFTKVIIDVSNVTAVWFMQGIINIGGDKSLSHSIGGTLGIQKMFTAPEANPLNWSAWTIQAFSKGIMTFALVCVAIYVFFNVIFLLIGRMVSLIFLLITAPIGFVGPLVPMLKEYSDGWWKELNDQAMMLPMFFLMVYLTLYIVDGVKGLLVATGNDFGPVNYVIYIIIIMMLLKSLKVAEKYSGEVGKMVGSIAKNATTFVAGVGFAGTVGRAAAAFRGSDVAQNFAQRNPLSGRIALGGLNIAANASGGAGSAYKNTLKAAGLDKTGLKDNFKSLDSGHEGTTKDEIASQKDYFKLIRDTKDNKRKLARAEYLQGGGTGLMGMALKNFGGEKGAEMAESLRKVGGVARAGDDMRKDKDVAKAKIEANKLKGKELADEKAALEKEVAEAKVAQDATRQKTAEEALAAKNREIQKFKDADETDKKNLTEAEKADNLANLAKQAKAAEGGGEAKPEKEESAPKEEKK